MTRFLDMVLAESMFLSENIYTLIIVYVFNKQSERILLDNQAKCRTFAPSNKQSV